MFRTLKTLFDGAQARAEDQICATVIAIEMIDQKIREAEASLKSAKLSLATLIQRERAERRQSEEPELAASADLTDPRQRGAG